MTDPAIRRVLDLVAEGRMTAAEAAPILDALDAATTNGPAGAVAPKASSDDAPARAVRIEVSDAGRAVVNLRVPLSLGRAAVDRIPGLSETLADRIREALDKGLKGPIVEVDDDGDGVRIVIE